MGAMTNGQRAVWNRRDWLYSDPRHSKEEAREQKILSTIEKGSAAALGSGPKRCIRGGIRYLGKEPSSCELADL